MRRHGRHVFHVNRRGETEDQAPHYDPFTAAEPCKCGSRERVYNGRSAVFCRRCGRKHSDPRPAAVGRFTIDAATIRAITPEPNAYARSVTEYTAALGLVAPLKRPSSARPPATFGYEE